MPSVLILEVTVLVHPQGDGCNKTNHHLRLPEQLCSYYEKLAESSNHLTVLLSIFINDEQRGGMMFVQLSKEKQLGGRNRWDLLLPKGNLRAALTSLDLYWQMVKVPPAYSQQLSLQVMGVPYIPEGACQPYFSKSAAASEREPIPGLRLSHAAFKAHFLS